MIKKTLISLLLVLICSIGMGQSEDFTKKVDDLIGSKMEELDLPGISLTVVKDGKIIYSKGHGVSNIETKEKVTENSVFHTASISKLFTALAVMELVADGKLNLDDKLTDVLTNLNYKDERLEKITIQQMLNHTSGMPDIFNYEWGSGRNGDSALRNYAENKRLRVTNEPGTNYRYSNLAYDVLGVVVEQASGQLFEDFVKERLLSPAGVKTTDFRYYLIPESVRTSPHTRNRVTKKVSVRDTYPYNREHAPSSTLNASSKELGLWMIHFLDLLEMSPRKAWYQQMLRPSTEASKYVGLGFHLGSINEHKSVLHFGGDEGYRSYLMMIPEKKLGFVILGNCDYNDDFRQEILNPIAARLAAEN